MRLAGWKLSRRLLLLAAAAVGGPGVLDAQGRTVLADSLVRTVALSAADSLRRAIAVSDMEGEAARLTIDLGREAARRTQTHYDVQRLEIESLDKRIELAKKEKREDDRKKLEADKDELERRLRVLDRWREVHQATIRAGEARRDAASERKKLIEAELTLVELRERWAVPDSLRLAGRLNPSEDALLRQTRRVLEARRNEADKRHQAGERDRELAEKQAALVEAQVVLRIGPRN
jgi:hypothetical protein